jgi:hypothetical protein
MHTERPRGESLVADEACEPLIAALRDGRLASGRRVSMRRR